MARPMLTTRKPLAQRFWKKIVRGSSPDECWAWTSAKNNKGYGVLMDDSQPTQKRIYAHRYSWTLHNGPIPNHDLCVLHRCDNPQCCNPLHLFLGTKVENNRDMYDKGRHFHAPHRTHCRKGHPLDEKNAYHPRGNPSATHCRACSLERYYKRKQQVLDGTVPAPCPHSFHAKKTHCIHGHPLSGDNLIVDPRTLSRKCATCQRKWKAKSNAKWNAIYKAMRQKSRNN